VSSLGLSLSENTIRFETMSWRDWKPGGRITKPNSDQLTTPTGTLMNDEGVVEMRNGSPEHNESGKEQGNLFTGHQ
jgi:hypothetical protein